MIVLGLDTATTGCSAAVWSDGGVRAQASEAMERGQAERLNPMIGEVMDQAGVTFRDLDAVAVTRGPGAFTGLRIGLAAARAIGLALSLPVIGVTTFAALVRAVPEDERGGRSILVAVNGKRRDVFVQVFDDGGKPISEGSALDPEGLPDALPPGRILIAGDGGPALCAALECDPDAGPDEGARIRFSSAMSPPDAVYVAAIAAEMLRSGEDSGEVMPRPHYIRPPDARLPAAPSQVTEGCK